MAIILVAVLFFGLLLLFGMLPDSPAKRLLRNDGPIFGPWLYWERQIREAGASRTQAEPVVPLPETDKPDPQPKPGPALHWARDETHPTWRLWDIDENVGLVSQQERNYPDLPAFYWAVFPDFEHRVLGQPVRGWASTLEAAQLLVELTWETLDNRKALH